MNQIAWQIFGGSKLKANTFIGGVASTITTSGALATKIGIASNRITNFKIVGSDIECSISGSYSIPFQCFYQDTNITSYVDIDGLVTDLGENVFRETTKIKELNFKGIVTLNGTFVDRESQIQLVYLKNCTSILGQFYNDFYPSKKVFYIPAVTTLGANSGYNSVFYNGASSVGCTIYAHPSLQTSNGGGVEGDLALAISNGATVRYVTNFTAPSPITNLSVGNVYGAAIQLIFTAPSSTNSIDYYEVWQNGVNTGKRITASGEYVTGLTLNTAYTFQLIPVDIFFNKSTSNVVSTSTLATYYVPTGDLVSYYKMENNVLDSWGSNNGIATAITYASGLVGQTAVFNGSTSFVTVPHNNSLSFGNGVNDFPFTVSFNMKFANKGTFAGYIPFAKSNNANNINDEYYLTIYNNFIYWRLMDKNAIGSHIGFSYNMASLSNNVSYNFSFTYDGSKTNSGIKFYINGILTSTTPFSTGTYTGMNIGTHPLVIGSGSDNNFKLSGELDEVSIWNAELTALQILEINAKLNTGQSLI